MADKKISALAAASVPLTGSEVLPIVQGGSTVKVSVDNLTTGKAVSASSLTLSGGTVNTIPFLNASKAVTTGTALQFDGTNIGLGLTPSASVLPSIESSFAIVAGRESVNVVHNAYYGASGWTYRASTFASQAFQDDGSHIWNTAVSGTAGNPITFNERMSLSQPGNLTLNSGNVVIGTAGKGITNSTGSVALNFSTVGTALTGGAQSVLTGSFNNIGTAQTITPANTNGGYIVITGIQPGIGSTTYTLPFVKRGGTAAIGTPSIAILTADPLLSVAASGGDIVVTPIAANTYITYAIYYTPLGA
jgi:hypothetical protein